MHHLLDYIRNESPQIAEQYADRKLIYLDLKYWILLRDYTNNSDRTIRQIGEKIQQLYQQKKCIFPVSDIIYYEVMKQGDGVKRAASIGTINKYSEGLAMVTAVHQFQIAFGYWIRERLKIGHAIPTQNRVWSKISLVIGFPGFAEQTENLNNELQKSFFDFAGKVLRGRGYPRKMVSSEGQEYAVSGGRHYLATYYRLSKSYQPPKNPYSLFATGWLREVDFFV